MCLLVKWIWKLTQDREGEWCKLMYQKYIPRGDFFSAQITRGVRNFGGGYRK